MNILITNGNILTSDTQALVNPVNCVGVMGKGLALEFKKQYPIMFEDYVDRCKRKEIKPGVPYSYNNTGCYHTRIINFPTKDHWRDASKIEWIENGMKILSEKYKEWGVTSIAIPALGCGNGDLSWEVVGPIIYRHISKWNIFVTIYTPLKVSKPSIPYQ